VVVLGLELYHLSHSTRPWVVYFKLANFTLYESHLNLKQQQKKTKKERLWKLQDRYQEMVGKKVWGWCLGESQYFEGSVKEPEQERETKMGMWLRS
jgi:hypothetical protein